MNRNYIPYFLLFYFFLLSVNSYADPTPNRVIIIGTKHNGNKEITHSRLLKILEKIKPDIILLEVDSTMAANCSIRKVGGTKTAEFLGIWKNPLEYTAARKYAEQNKDVCIAPFDIYIPNRKSYIDYQLKMERSHTAALQQLAVEKKYSLADSMAYHQYKSINNAFIDILKKDLLAINRETLIDTVQRIIAFESKEIRTITNHYPTLEPFQNWYNYSNDFWSFRNKGMCERIYRELLANSDRTIVILTGLLHKYYLNDYLNNPNLNKLCEVIPLSKALEK
jgi:hypothetical protein